ncbi:hypothetical protein AWZ03_015446, partial [Drosophila navojoa]
SKDLGAHELSEEKEQQQLEELPEEE